MRKQKIKEQVLKAILFSALDYGYLKDMFQDIEGIGTIFEDITEEEEEYAYELINKLVNNKDLESELKELLAKHIC